MFRCPGCGESFEFLRSEPNPSATTFCIKCEARCDANKTDDPVAIKEAESLRQCKRCALTFRFLSVHPCGVCRDELGGENISNNENIHAIGQSADTLPGGHVTPQGIFKAATAHAAQASIPRLNQAVSYVFPTPINPNLMSAHRIKALSKGNAHFRGPTLNPLSQRPRVITPIAKYNIFMSASYYPIPIANKNGGIKQSKLVELSNIQDSFSVFTGTHSTRDALRILAEKLYAEYHTLQYDEKVGRFPLFSEMKFQLPNTAQGKILPLQDEWFSGSITSLINTLKGINMLGAKFNDTLTIRMVFHQKPTPSLDASDQDSDTGILPEKDSDSEESHGTIDSPKDVNASTNIRGSVEAEEQTNHAKEINSGGLNDDSPLFSGEESDQDPRPEPTGIVSQGGLEGNKRKRDSVDDIEDDELDAEQPPAQTQEPKPAPAYNPTVDLGQPQITYTSRKMEYIYRYHVTDDGDVIEVKDYDEEDLTLLVADNWINDMDNDVPRSEGGSFLGKGGFKFGAMGIHRRKRVAVLQSYPRFPNDPEFGTKENDNFCDLVHELRTLSLLGYFMKGFNHRIATSPKALSYPEMKPNLEGAFIGKLDLDANPGCGSGLSLSALSREDGPEKGAFPYTYVLVVPYLHTDDEKYIEERYLPPSGIKAPDSTNDYAAVLSAFNHYTFEASRGNMLFGDLQGIRQPQGGTILFDPQLHTKGRDRLPAGKTAASWDCGSYMMDRFVEEHYCEDLCHDLKLRKPGAPPPKVKPTPAKAGRWMEDSELKRQTRRSTRLGQVE